MTENKPQDTSKKTATPGDKPSDRDVKEWTKNTEKSPDDKE